MKFKILKMNLAQSQCLILLLTVGWIESAPQPTENYANSLELAPDTFYFLWNYTSTDILMEVHVKTTGWVGFGLSPNGGMDGSNVVVFWIDPSTGDTHFTARHIKGRDVIVNKAQNWIPIMVARRNEYLVAKFTRKIKICDKSGEDMDIPDGTPHIIFSYGTRFEDGDITYHDFRGTKTVQLTSSLNTKVDIDMSQVETAEFRVNVFFYFTRYLYFNNNLYLCFLLIFNFHHLFSTLLILNMTQFIIANYLNCLQPGLKSSNI